MKNVLFSSLKFRVGVLFLSISLLPMVAVGLISYLSSEKALEHEFFENFKALSQAKEEAIIRYLRTKVKVTSGFASDIFIRNTLEKIEQKGADASLLSVELGKYIKEEKEPVDPEIEKTYILNDTGTIVASSDKSELYKDKSQDEYFIEGIKGTHIKDPYLSSAGFAAFAVSVPMRSRTTGNIIGVMVNRYSLGELNKILDDKEGLGETGESYLVNKEGYMITDSRFTKDTFLKQMVDSEPVRLYKKENKTMVGMYKDYRGKSIVGSSDGDHLHSEFRLRWLLLTEIDTSEAFAPAVKLRNTVILMIFIVMILVSLIASIVSQYITSPIIKLAGAAKKVAEGDLSSSIEDIKSEDEIGILAASFKTMLINLNEIMSKAKDAVNQITSASTEILSASQQQAASAREQSSAVNETTSAAAELSKSAEQIGESIRQVSQAANHALAGMAKIKEAIGKTGDKITSLSEKSQQIGKITDLINDVADQTNLLAVNAAIEAARAGEHGRGFTVVADEIRKLADSTAKSTKDITALIEIIQHEMSNAIMAMEQSVVNVNEEVKLSQESAESAKEIAMGATQQVSGSKQIADAMGNINEAMKQIASGAGQASAAAKQLTNLAVDLKTITARFKL